MHITKSNKIILDGILLGDFEDIQEKIFKENPNLVRKYKIKARYLGKGRTRYIADWTKIIEEYYSQDDILQQR